MAGQLDGLSPQELASVQAWASARTDAEAICVSGGSGARLQLDIPDTGIAELLKLMLWRDMELRVTVRPVRE